LKSNRLLNKYDVLGVAVSLRKRMFWPRNCEVKLLEDELQEILGNSYDRKKRKLIERNYPAAEYSAAVQSTKRTLREAALPSNRRARYLFHMWARV